MKALSIWKMAMIFEFLVLKVLTVPIFIILAKIYPKIWGFLLFFKMPLVKLGQEWRHPCPSFTRGIFNFKRRPHNFWNNWARLIKFGTCNISGMRNSKIMFIFKIDNVFIYYSWGVTFVRDIITKKTKCYNFWSRVAFELRLFANFIIFHALS